MLRFMLKSLPHIPEILQPFRKRPFQNILGKGENADNQHFLLLPKCFLPFLKQNSNIDTHLLCRLYVL